MFERCIYRSLRLRSQETSSLIHPVIYLSLYLSVDLWYLAMLCTESLFEGRSDESHRHACLSIPRVKTKKEKNERPSVKGRGGFGERTREKQEVYTRLTSHTGDMQGLCEPPCLSPCKEQRKPRTPEHIRFLMRRKKTEWNRGRDALSRPSLRRSSSYLACLPPLISMFLEIYTTVELSLCLSISTRSF